MNSVVHTLQNVYVEISDNMSMYFEFMISKGNGQERDKNRSHEIMFIALI